MAKREIIQKLVLLGDASTDKSALLRPLVYSMKPEKYITTIGTKVTKKTVIVEVEVGDRKVQVRNTLLIWDIVGQKQYSKLHPVYYQGAQGALVVCHAQRPATMASVAGWVKGLTEVVGPVPVGVVVNCGSLEELQRADIEALRAQLGLGDAPVFLTCPEQPKRTDDALFHIARVMAQECVTRKGLPAEQVLEGEVARRPRGWPWRRRK
jgi:GTPase SAR1 family protein